MAALALQGISNHRLKMRCSATRMGVKDGVRTADNGPTVFKIMFARLKHMRHVATRFDRCLKAFHSAFALAAPLKLVVRPAPDVNIIVEMRVLN